MIYFDDISVGDSFVSSGRTIFDADIIGFAGLSGDFNQLHVDDKFAAEQAFGRRIAHGMLVASVVSGLRCKIDDMAIIAFMETQRRFLNPTFPGDTIEARYVVEKAKQSKSKPEMGIVTFAVTVVNQRGETVQEGYDVLALEARNT